jgi:hypothetical protein
MPEVQDWPVGDRVAPATRPDGDGGQQRIDDGAWTDGAQTVCPPTLVLWLSGVVTCA